MINISRAQAIDGWMSDRELQWLAERAKSAKIIVEFGCYKGRSTRALADNTDGIIYAVDPWSGDYYSDDGSRLLFSCNTFEEFHHHLQDHILSMKVFPIHQESVNFDPIISPDFIFIDGNHSYEHVCSDIATAFRIAHPRAIIAGHDYGRSDWPGVRQAVDEKLGTKFLIEDSIWWTERHWL